MPDLNHIFLSYSHADAEIATELASRLKDAGLRCFVAERDIIPTQKWEPAIRDEVRDSKCLLILLTPRSYSSTWVAIETGAAWVLEKDIIPATMFVDVEQLPEPISQYQARRVETNAQVTTLVQELHERFIPKKESQEQKSKESTDQLLAESFAERSTWDRLQRIGSWEFDSNASLFSGKGPNDYLLSYNTYGLKPFTIETRIGFSSLPKDYREVNAGIIFGWQSSGNTRRYLNLKFSGVDVLLEEVGAEGGAAGWDFGHLSDAAPFRLVEGRYYDMIARIDGGMLDLTIDGELIHSIKFDSDPCGRVGIRPWRSEVRSDRFDVHEGTANG